MEDPLGVRTAETILLDSVLFSKGETYFFRTLLESALFRLGQLQLPSDPSGYRLHPDIEAVSDSLLRNGHHREAALNAYMKVIERVQDWTGLRGKDGKLLKGEPLMRRAFDCINDKTPVVRFNNLLTEPERDEQQGLAYLYLGLALLRNAKAHEIRALDDPNRTYEYLALASLLIRLLDIGTVVPTVAVSGSNGATPPD